MRSRFAAFAEREIEYLVKTLHPEHPDLGDAVALRRSLRASVQRYRYVRLAILGAGEDWVHFRAELFEKGKPRGFTERSVFARDGMGWRYLRGELEAPELGAGR